MASVPEHDQRTAEPQHQSKSITQRYIGSNSWLEAALTLIDAKLDELIEGTQADNALLWD